MEVLKTDCALCVNCCGVNAYVDDGVLVKVEGEEEHFLNKGKLCPKGEHLTDWVYAPDRVKYPMKRVGKTLKRISWDQALDEIGSKLQALKKQHGAHTMAIYTGSVGVENIELAAFMQRFRGAYGSPNFLCVESICYRVRILARQITFGRYPVEEPEKARCIILWGANPDASLWMTGVHIRNEVKKGLKLITIDPRRIPLAKFGIHIQPRPGTDCAIALAMMNVIIEEDLWDKEFVDKWTVGFDRLVEHVKEYTPEKAEEISGVPAIEIRKIARIFATTKGACILQGVCSMDQQINSLQNSRAFAILQTITGNIDVPGGWATTPLLPLTDLRLPLDEKPIGADEYPVFYKFGKRPAPYGQAMLLTETILSEKPYPIKALLVGGGNPALDFPDTKKFLEAAKKLELLVVIDPFMSETADLADYVLPACTFLEKDGVGGYPYGLMHGTSYIMLRKKVIDPLWESKADWWVWSELGHKMGYGEYFPWKTDEEVVEHLFSKSVITTKQLKANPGGAYFGEKVYKVYEQTGFGTESGKIEIFSAGLERFGFPGLPTHIEPSQSAVANPELTKKYPEILLTGARQIEYIHTQGHNLPALRAIRQEPEVEVHPATAHKYDIVNGEMCGIETPRGMIKMRALVTQDILEGVVSIPHGWAVANANILTDIKMKDAIVGYPETKAIACRLVKL
ncbi:MAG: molybdopterin-dependent oxidoreductase [Dehalococcoidia bacterium]|nr:molybdopterin-dependent oxidoreductase [Dehalococcoidia bacterium]MDZ4247063.1 molybdopterin-dependent oxidoreductase [Dehalococcoidia bacterium]